MDSNCGGPPREKGRSIPPAEATVVTPLRQLHIAEGAENAGSPRRNSMTDGNSVLPSSVEKSTLSPLAPVFVPKHFKVQLQEETDGPSNTEQSYRCQMAEAELISFIDDVTLSPGEFDTKINYLTSVLGGIDDIRGLTDLVNTIFEHGVREPNFRYSGARLCNHLGNNLHLKNLDDDTFTNLLLDRCHVECLKRNDLAAGDYGDKYLRGLLLFVAELFSQMFSREDNSYKVKHVAACIPDMMHTLLQAMSKENIKCTIQVLKLTGANLEDLEKSGNNGETPNMDSLIHKLRELSQKHDIDVTAERMIKSVLELREINWGRTAVSSSGSSASSAAEDSLPILCGPDGVPLSKEEEVFLEGEVDTLEASEDGNYPNHYGNEEMDDEIAAAYEVFLRESGQ